MDDLISRKSLLEEFRSLCGPQTGDGWDNMGVRNLIMRQKTVDAMPVEWLRKVRNDERLTLDDVETIDLLLAWWQKEREANE